MNELKTLYLKDWNELLQAQSDAPDYPYEGMPYSGTYAAEDERFDFWRRVAEEQGDEFSDELYAHRHD